MADLAVETGGLTMRFIKMHGIGNDYVYINTFQQRVPDPALLAPRIADRHLGVGGDGLILVGPPENSADADVRMRMFNTDGSEAEMCGNGIRCVCKLAHDHGISDANPMRVQTRSGVLSLDYTLDDQGKVDLVTVDMGEPILQSTRVPVSIPDLSRVINHSMKDLVQWPANVPEDWGDVCGLDQRMTCVSIGNPHVVLYCREVSKVPLEHIGPVLENHPVFPNRINVHFVHVHSPQAGTESQEVSMRTWERGSGITLGCGTGASAVCVAGVLTDRSGRKILAHLPGGDLRLQWRESDNHVYMTGPAREVFSGEWELDD